jgi:hypothetical protein
MYTYKHKVINAAYVQLAAITLSLNSDLTLLYSFCDINAAYVQLVALGTTDQNTIQS